MCGVSTGCRLWSRRRLEESRYYLSPCSFQTDLTRCSVNGSATKTSPDRWNDDALAGIFSSKYTKPMATYYPYAAPSRPSNVTVTKPADRTGGRGVPLGTVLGSVAGVVVIILLAAAWFIYRRHQPKNEPAGSVDKEETPRETPRSTGPSVERADTSYAALESPSTGMSPVSEKQSEANVVSPTTAVTDVSPIQPSQADSSPIYEMECKISPQDCICKKLMIWLIAPVRKCVELPTDFNQQPKAHINNDNFCHGTNRHQVSETDHYQTMQTPRPASTRGHDQDQDHSTEIPISDPSLQRKRFSFTPSIRSDRSYHDCRPSSSSTTSSSSSSSSSSGPSPLSPLSSAAQQESNFDKIPYSSRIVVNVNAWRGDGPDGFGRGK